MRVLILTDSLGCPRKETHVSETWTDRIIKKWSKDFIIYTYCVHGLSASKINLEYIKEISPDIIIMQIGIVDACRRALRSYEEELISRIPGVRTLIRKICSKFHYQFTVIRNIHDCSIKKFNSILNSICENTEGRKYFIRIAPAGHGLVKKVYNVKKDVATYNFVSQNIKGLEILDPYGRKNPESYLLPDGHHLNSLGNEMVYKSVDKILNIENEEK